MHVHAPPTRCGVAATQLVQLLGPAPLQVTQLASHAAHVEAEAAWCVDGHALMQAPLRRKGATAGHAVHSLAEPPLQLEHEPSHATHSELASA